MRDYIVHIPTIIAVTSGEGDDLRITTQPTEIEQHVEADYANINAAGVLVFTNHGDQDIVRAYSAKGWLRMEVLPLA